MIQIDIKITEASELAVLRSFADQLEFPDYFGENWDAFDDCLFDFVEEKDTDIHFMIQTNEINLTEPLKRRIISAISDVSETAERNLKVSFNQ